MRRLTAKVFYCTCAEFFFSFFFFFLLPLCFVYFAAHSHLFFSFSFFSFTFPGYREIASLVRCSLNNRVFFGFELGCTALPRLNSFVFGTLEALNTSSSSYLYSSHL